MNSRFLIDEESGEIVGKLAQGDRVIRAQSLEYLGRKYTSDLRKRKFVRMDEDEGRLIVKELSANERAVLFQLQYYVAYESGLICYPNGKDICFSDIIEMTGLSRRTAAQVLESLVAKDILYKGRNSRKVQYYMNPWIASKGVMPNKTLKEMFGNYRIRSRDGVMWKDL